MNMLSPQDVRVVADIRQVGRVVSDAGMMRLEGVLQAALAECLIRITMLSPLPSEKIDSDRCLLVVCS
jgi:hypothetical protein